MSNGTSVFFIQKLRNWSPPDMKNNMAISLSIDFLYIIPISMAASVVAYSVRNIAAVSVPLIAHRVPSILNGGSYGRVGCLTDGFVFSLNLPKLPMVEGIMKAANPKPTIQMAYFLKEFMSKIYDVFSALKMRNNPKATKGILNHWPILRLMLCSKLT